MTTARCELVDVSVTRWYHCLSRCVRGGFLMGEGFEDRKQWIEDRLELLDSAFSVSIGGFAIMDNHLHVLCRLNPDEASGWSDEDVARRWLKVFPPKTLKLDDPKVVRAWVDQQTADAKRIQVLRERLQDLGWFMKSLKEPLSRMANKQDGCRGAFWEARYKSIAILDTEALLATCAYIDLNPLAAGIAETPESSPHTSISQRVGHVREQGKIECLKAARDGSVAGSKAAGDIEQSHWLVPLEDRRSHANGNSNANSQANSVREGMLETFSLGSYLLLVDYTGRLFRNGKANMNAGVKEVFERLGTSCEFWSDRIKKMLSSRDLRGSYFAANSEKVVELGGQRGKRALNLCPQPIATAVAVT